MSAGTRDRRIFVDTSAYYAAADSSDVAHGFAARSMRRLASEGRTLVTTNVVLIELHGLLTSRIHRDVAWRTLHALRASQQIVRVRPRDEVRAIAILEQYDDRDFSLADALSFAVMERLGITRALSLDRRFQQYGWDVEPFDEVV